MSLLFWAPLIRDTNSQGLLSLTPTTQGTISFISGGKLGNCLSAGTSTQTPNGISYNTNLVTELGTKFSCSIWVKPLGNHVHYNGTFISSGNWNNQCWSFGVNQDNTKVDIFCAKYNVYLNCTVPVNEWTHLVSTADNGLIKLYKNGEYVGQTTRTDTVLISDASNFCIGRETYANGYFSFNGNITDVRIYNHTLSTKEIKLLSQGLVCHYTFNENRPTENLFSWQDRGNTTIILNNYQNVGSFTQFGDCLTFDPSTTVGQKYTISFWARSPNGSTKLQLYNSNGSPRYFYFSTTLTNNLGADWEYFTYTFTNSDRGSGSETVSQVRRIEIYMPSKTGGEVKEIKIEAGETATDYIPAPNDRMYGLYGSADNTILDSSGYNYVGKLSEFTRSSDTSPRNNNSIYFNGEAQLTRESITSEVKTVAFWLNTPKAATTVAFADYKSKIAFGFNSGKSIITGCAGRSTYVHPSTAISENTWHHIAIVRTDAADTDQLYIDGVLQTPSSGKDNWTHQTDILSMTGRSYANSYKMSCYISDFRMYVTALSAEDIQQLYNAPASISNNGILMTQGEFIESNTWNTNAVTLKTVSGAVASFADGADDVPIKTATFDIAPTLDGVSSVNVVRTGKNLFTSVGSETDKFVNTSGAIQATSGWMASDYIEVPSNATLYFNPNSTSGGTAKHAFYDSTKTFISYVDSGAGSFTTPSNCKYMRFSYRSASTDIQLEVGSSATAYTAYTTPETRTITLGQTVYGGSVTVDEEGECELSDEMTTPIDLGDLSWGYYPSGDSHLFSAIVTASGVEPYALSKCESDYTWVDVRYSSQLANKQYHIYQQGANIRIAIRDDSYSDADNFDTAVTGNDITFTKATPTTSDLDPITPITSALGVNNIWCDTGDVETLTYRANNNVGGI